jgi:hypothetical protein
MRKGREEYPDRELTLTFNARDDGKAIFIGRVLTRHPLQHGEP